eukprot:scaffold24406_cov17-Tisochrysis_lutea.AAC.1
MRQALCHQYPNEGRGCAIYLFANPGQVNSRAPSLVCMCCIQNLKTFDERYKTMWGSGRAAKACSVSLKLHVLHTNTHTCRMCAQLDVVPKEDLTGGPEGGQGAGSSNPMPQGAPQQPMGPSMGQPGMAGMAPGGGGMMPQGMFPFPFSMPPGSEALLQVGFLRGKLERKTV